MVLNGYEWWIGNSGVKITPLFVHNSIRSKRLFIYLWNLNALKTKQK